MVEKAGVHARTRETKKKYSNLIKQKPGFNSSGSPADRILQLQRTAGNQAVQRLIKSRALQAKLKIGQPNDIYEQEADKVAEKVMRMPDPASVPQFPVNPQPKGSSIQSATRHPEKDIQRKEDDDEEEKIVQMKRGSPQYSAGSQSSVPSSVHEALSSSGFPLDSATRSFMEPRFGHDFSHVRVHNGPAAEQSAREVNAHAYTLGRDIVFGTGRFTPGTLEGRRLIAHELTHVVQQSGAEGTRVVQRQQSPAKQPQAVLQDFIAPVDNYLLVAPGEQILFSARFNKTFPILTRSNSEFEYSAIGGGFWGPNRGEKKYVESGVFARSIPFFIPESWNGTSKIQVDLKIRQTKDQSGNLINNILHTVTWNFGLKKYFPTEMIQVQGTGDLVLPTTGIIYTYKIGPPRKSLLPPFYHHMTILERFDDWDVNIKPEEIIPSYRKKHSLDNPAAIQQHFINGPYSGTNTTFDIDAKDQIYDLHSYPDLPPSAALSDPMAVQRVLIQPKDIEIALTQVYEAGPGLILGRYKITRILKVGGSTWYIRKEPYPYPIRPR